MTIQNGNTIIGDAQNKALSAAEQSPDFVPFDPNNPDASGFGGDYNLLTPTGAPIVYDNQVITVKSGNWVLIGDVQNFDVIAQGNDHYSGPYHPYYNTIFGEDVTYGDDKLTAGNGNNVLVGDVQHFTMAALGGVGAGPTAFTFNDIYYTNQGADAEGVIINDTFNMGDDVLKAGSGNNEVHGDVADLSLTAIPGLTIGNAVGAGYIGITDLPITFDMGNDSITLGNGDNTVAGDIGQLSFLADNSQTHNGTVFGAAGGIASTIVNAGDDQITTGNGHDVITGDMFDVSLTVLGGSADSGYTTAGNISRIGLDLGNDTVSAGGGDDFIYGDMHSLTLEANAGKVISDGSHFAAGGVALDPSTGEYVSDPFSSYAGAGIGRTTVAMGDDTLNGDAGNDHIWGDLQSFSFSLNGGIVEDINGGDFGGGQAHAVATRNSFTMGNDTINGGNGNDVLYGDAETVSFARTAGTDSTGNGLVEASFSGTISDADHADALPIASPDIGSVFKFGDDVVNGGAGNDYLAGDALNLVGLQDFLSSPDAFRLQGDQPFDLDTNPHNINAIIWGNDTLTGGAGSDTFAFALVDLDHDNKLEMQGNDVITDFNLAQDTLELHGVSSLADLSSVTFTHQGNNTVINFDDSTRYEPGTVNDDLSVNITTTPVNSSITLQNVNINSFAEIPHLTLVP